MFSHPYSLANHVGNFPALSQCHRTYNIAHWASLELLPLLTLYFNVRAESQWFGELDFHSSFQKIFQSLIDLIINACFMIVWLNIHFRILFYNAYKFFWAISACFLLPDMCLSNIYVFSMCLLSYAPSI